MREVRMTFGEHLEELRRRIIFCLLYLLIGVTITMVYGKDLMEWTLGPHYQAIRAAQRDRLVARMEKTVRRLGELTSTRPRELRPGEKPIVEGPVQWVALFAREVALPRIALRLEEPWRRLAAELRRAAPVQPAPEATGLAPAVEALGKELSTVLASEFAPGLESPLLSNIPARFAAVEKSLRELSTAVGPNKFQLMIGWGKDMSSVLVPLGEFVKFLEIEREQALRTDISLADLHTVVKESRLPGALNEILVTLETDTRAIAEEGSKRIMVISYLESFMAYLKVALIFGVFLTLPFLLYEIWKFVGAGLYPHEQKYVVVLLPFSLALFIGGALFGYFALIPVGLEFLAGWGLEEVELNFTLESYTGLFFTLTLILGLVFQTPLIMIFLSKIGVVDVDAFRRMRRFAVFAGVCLAVILTPPDPFSWSLMAAPMILLYEVGIVACKLMDRLARKKVMAESTA